MARVVLANLYMKFIERVLRKKETPDDCYDPDDFESPDRQERIWKKTVGDFVIDYYKLTPSKLERLRSKGFPPELLQVNKFIELHLMPDSTREKLSPLGSLSQLVQFCEENNIPEETFIIGVSHLSSFGKRYGFTVQDVKMDVMREFSIYLGATEGDVNLRKLVERYADVPDEELPAEEKDAIKEARFNFDAYEKMRGRFNFDDIKLAYISVKDLKDGFKN